MRFHHVLLVLVCMPCNAPNPTASARESKRALIYWSKCSHSCVPSWQRQGSTARAGRPCCRWRWFRQGLISLLISFSFANPWGSWGSYRFYPPFSRGCGGYCLKPIPVISMDEDRVHPGWVASSSQGKGLRFKHKRRVVAYGEIVPHAGGFALWSFLESLCCT